MHKCNAEKSSVLQNSTAASSCETSSQKIKLNFTFRSHQRHACMRSVMCSWHWQGKEELHVWEKRESQEKCVPFRSNSGLLRAF